MINLFSETDDYIKAMNLLSKTNDFIRMMNLLINMERCNFWKEEVFPLVCSKYLSSWTGLGKSGHVQSQSFGQILHISDPKLTLSRNFSMILHGFAWRS